MRTGTEAQRQMRNLVYRNKIDMEHEVKKIQAGSLPPERKQEHIIELKKAFRKDALELEMLTIRNHLETKYEVQTEMDLAGQELSMCPPYLKESYMEHIFALSALLPQYEEASHVVPSLS